ncbi:MAG: carboxypeptidase-like regulatory domain-containing protein [Armatimonadota bacterium]
MTRRTLKLLLIAAVTATLAGCGGGTLVGALIGLVGVGNVIGEVENLLEEGDDPTKSTVLLDGQPLPINPDAAGRVRLRDLPAGRHLLQVVAPGGFRGAVTIINVQPNSDLRLDNLEAQVGGRVRGAVTLPDDVPACRVLVYALPGGAQLVREGQSVIALPPADTHYAAYTDGNGEYTLQALAPGDYLITAAVAGFSTDVHVVSGLTERQSATVRLALTDAAGPLPGTVQGSIAGEIGGGATRSLAGASVWAELDRSYRPLVPDGVIERVQTWSGTELRPSPWFAWEQLATLSDAGGSYLLDLPSGTPRIVAFAYGYQPGYQDGAVNAGQTVRVDFQLPEP